MDSRRYTHIVSGIFGWIERFVPDIEDKIIKEINLYKSAAGDFGRNIEVRARNNLLPSHGGGFPNLSWLAIHILSQTCSVMSCKRNQIPFEQIVKT